jgi:predicted HTH domain antitoxin
MRTISLKIPEMAELDNLQLYMILASSLYEQGKLSLGQAAEVANLSKRTFTELLGSYGVSLFNYPATDLVQDVSNAVSYAV